MADGDGDLWVFGYGSLIWRPGFAFAERAAARLHGYHRSLCIYSHVHRGTPEMPGLVLGLARGGVCRGVAYRIAPELAGQTLAYLREREQATTAYVEKRMALWLGDGRRVAGLTYVADPRHLQFAGRLPVEELLRHVRQGRGISGENPDYVLNTHEHLRQMGIRDKVLADLAERLADARALPS